MPAFAHDAYGCVLFLVSTTAFGDDTLQLSWLLFVCLNAELPDYQVACPKLQNRFCLVISSDAIFVVQTSAHLSANPCYMALNLGMVLRSVHVLLDLVHCLSHLSSLCGFSASPRLPGLIWLACLAAWLP